MTAGATVTARLRRAVEELPEWLANHIFRVEAEALRIARRYGEDEERARISALGHDLVRHKNDAELLELARRYDIVPDEIELAAPILVHGPIAARMLRLEYGITDEDIIAGVDFHTTAHRGMTQVEKVLFIADKIEPSKLRANQELQEVLGRAQNDLDGAVVRFLELRIEEAIKNATPVHPRIIEARNYFLLNR